MPEERHGIRLTFTSNPRFLEPVRTLIHESALLIGLEEEEARDVVLAVQEGMANVIRHCYKDCTDERIDLFLAIGEDELEIRIDDYGEFVDPSTIKSRDLDDVRPGGLGVHLMNRVMDDVGFEKNEWGGTTLTLLKRAPEKAAEQDG